MAISKRRYAVIFTLVVVAILWKSFSSEKQPVRSVTRQSINYFARPGAGGLLAETLDAESAWHGDELRNRTWRWRTELSQIQREDLISMIKKINKKRNITTLTKQDFDWPPWTNELFSKLKKDLSAVRKDALGFHVIRGFPSQQHGLSLEEQKTLFWGLGTMIGITGAQDSDGKVLSDVRDEGGDPRTERQYKTRANIRFHVDAADVVGLLCVHEAKQGGSSRIASSVAAYNELIRRRLTRSSLDGAHVLSEFGREHLQQLFQPILLDVRGTAGIQTISVPPIRYSRHGVLRTFYHAEYFQSAYNYPESPQPSPKLMDLLHEYEEILDSEKFVLEMRFLQGDVQLLNNHQIVHSRTAFVDHDEPERRRHLLRLWLSLDEHLSIADLTSADAIRDWMSREAERVRFIAMMIQKKLVLFAQKIWPK